MAMLFVVGIPCGAQLAPVIHNITGCPVQQGPATSGCIPPLDLTITGDNFGSGGSLLLVNISSLECIYAVSYSTTILECRVRGIDALVPLDTYLPVTVMSKDTQVVSASVPYVSFSVPPPIILRSVSGCMDMGDAGTYNCSTSSSVLTMRGAGFTPDMPSDFWTLTYSTASGSSRLLPQSLTYISPTMATFSSSELAAYSGGRLNNNGQVNFILGHRSLSSPSALSFTFFPTAENSAPAFVVPPTNLSITSVSSAGCIHFNNTATGCSKPASFTLSGSGFSGLAGTQVTIGNETCDASYYYVHNTSIQCWLSESWSRMPTGTVLPVIALNLVTLQQSAPFPGVNFAPLVQPYISSIAGCQGSGQLTSLCNMGSDSLTLTGGGFVLDTEPLMLRITTGSAGYDEYNALPYVKDPGTIQFTISQAFENSLNELRAVKGNIGLFLQHGAMISNTVALTIAPPMLNITSISSKYEFSCVSALPFLLVDCTPDQSILILNGFNFFYPITVTVGGLPCLGFLEGNPSYLRCLLPALEVVTPGFAYDIVVTQGQDDADIVSIPAAVVFFNRPAINTITSQYCANFLPPQTGNYILYCAAGDVLTVIGSSFSSSGPLFVILASRGMALSCNNVTVLASTALTCVLPSLNSSLTNFFSGVQATVQVYENATHFSNKLTAVLYRTAIGLSIYDISGCSGVAADTRGAFGCIPGANLTIVGSNFIAGSLVDIYEPSEGVLYACQVPRYISSSLMTCRLPCISRLESENVLPVRVRSNSLTSNWVLALHYSNGVNPGLPADCAASPNLVSTSYRTALIACVVVLSVVVAGLVILVLFFRCHSSPALFRTAGRALMSVREESVTRDQTASMEML